MLAAALIAIVLSSGAEPYPRVGLYGGAGSGPFAPWRPFVNQSSTATDYAECDSAARYPVISLCPNFTDDSTGGAWRSMPMAAIAYMRQRNPGIVILAEPLGNVAFIGNRWTADSLKRHAYYHKVVRALDAASGDSMGVWLSTQGGGQIVDTNGGEAGGYTLRTARTFLWKQAAGWQMHFWGVPRSSAYGGQGATQSNVNLTAPGVIAGLVGVIRDHFIERRQPDGSFVFDGVMLDLNQPSFAQAVTQEGDVVDHVRAGFATSWQFVEAWTEAHHAYMAAIRRAADEAGRPDFIISGNSGSGIAYDSMNGWMREGWPWQQGGSWHSNLRRVPGGQVNDSERFAHRPQMSWVFAFPAMSGADSLGAGRTVQNPLDQARYRFGLGTASLTGARFVYEPPFASIPRGGGFHRWWMDEASVEAGASSPHGTGTGWLGQPLARFRQSSPPHGSGVGRGHGQDSQGEAGAFDADAGAWSLARNQQTDASRVTDTTFSGAGALRIRVATRQAVDYLAGATGKRLGSYAAGDTASISFWARASAYLPMSVGLRDASSGQNRLDAAQGTKEWIDTTWTHHRIIGRVTGACEAAPYFWPGDTTGTFWVDEVRVVRGRPRGGLYYREFERGLVVVNPYASVDSFTVSRRMRRISGRHSAINDGSAVSAGASVPVAPSDALFLLDEAAVYACSRELIIR